MQQWIEQLTLLVLVELACSRYGPHVQPSATLLYATETADYHNRCDSGDHALDERTQDSPNTPFGHG